MNPQEYKKDIEALKTLSRESSLSPLRQEVLKARLMSRLSAPAESANKLPARFLWVEQRTSLAYAIVPAVLVITLTGGTVFASQAALPGEVLYPVKRLTEQVEFKLAPTEQAKVEVQAKHAEKRLEEIIKLDQKAEVASVPEDKAKVEEHREEAKVETRTELETALNTLTEVQAKLETKGKNEAATSIQNVIQNLKDKATPTFKVEVETEDHGRVRVKFPNLPSRWDRHNRNSDTGQEQQPEGSQEEDVQNDGSQSGPTGGARWGQWGDKNQPIQESPSDSGTNGTISPDESSVEDSAGQDKTDNESWSRWFDRQHSPDNSGSQGEND